MSVLYMYTYTYIMYSMVYSFWPYGISIHFMTDKILLLVKYNYLGTYLPKYSVITAIQIIFSREHSSVRIYGDKMGVNCKNC